MGLSLHDVQARIEALADAGKVAELVRYALKIELDPSVQGPASTLEPVFRHALCALTLVPSLEAANAVIELMQLERVRTASPPAQRPRGSMVARLLGQTHNRETCAAVIDRHGDTPAVREVLACWVQERVTRGDDYRGLAPIERLWSLLRFHAHPLAQLPLHRLPIEAAFEDEVPYYRLNSDANPFPFVADEVARQKAPPRTAIESREVEAPPQLAAMFDDWRERPGAAVEARVFAMIDPPALEPGDLIAPVLCRLPLACIESAKTIELQPIGDASALAMLFSVAVNRGPRGTGRGAAYARLDAWRTIAGLLDRDDNDLDHLAASAHDAGFSRLRSDSAWFQHTDWDFGLVCLRPGGRSIAVLAATHAD